MVSIQNVKTSGRAWRTHEGHHPPAAADAAARSAELPLKGAIARMGRWSRRANEDGWKGL